MSMTAPNSYVTPASPVVVSQIERLNSKADLLTIQAQNAIRYLQTISFSEADLSTDDQFTDADLNALINQLGPLPEQEYADWTEGLDLSAGNEQFVFDPRLLQRLQERFPEFVLPTVPPLTGMPEAPSDPGEYSDPDAPTRPVLRDYEAPEIDLDIPVPEYTDVTSEVPFPTLRTITLPEVPVLALDEIKFEGQAPVFSGTAPDIADFQFENETYDSALLERTKQAALAQMDGETGLPPAVELAMFERAREREVELGERQVQQAQDEWAARGHRAPGGPLARRVDRARFDASTKISQLNRDQYIEGWRIQIEQFRNGLASAIALEEQAMRLFAQAEDRRLQATRMKLDLALAVYNAAIAKFNADAGVYQVQAQVYRDRFAAEQTKIQVYGEQLRAQQLIGELNAQDVQIYVQRLNALQVNADIYRTRIQGYQAQFDAVNAKINVYRAQLEANNQLMGVYTTDVQAFQTLVNANQSKLNRFSIKADIYAKKVDGWRAAYDGALAGYNGQLEGLRLQNAAYESDTQRLSAWSSGEGARLRALADKYQAIATEVGARSQYEQTRSQVYLAMANAALERYRAASEILIKKADLNINSGLTAANLTLRANETAAQTLSQLAAGFTSAANVNASISDSSSSGLSYNFSGEIEVA